VTDPTKFWRKFRLSGQDKPGRKSYISPNRKKGYLEFVGNGYVTEIDPVIESHVRYRFTIAG
jgi:hypothetical protein